MAECANGHELTEENTSWVKRGDRPGMRRRCLTCKRESNIRHRGLKDSPSRAEMLKQATDFLHEDIEDLIRFGATYSEIIERGGYANWGNMYKSLKRRGREDLIQKMREKRLRSDPNQLSTKTAPPTRKKEGRRMHRHRDVHELPTKLLEKL